MNRPTKALDVHQRLAEAYNSRDLNTVLGIYDSSGVIVAQPNSPVSGKEKFEEAVRAILAIPGKMEIKTVYCLEAGDMAVGRSEWSIVDHGKTRVAAKGIEVMKRQADGTWKVVIDHAFGAELN
ncbi:MAG: SgcJ/EcaC family oxidoreductase [Cyclobacteriaceae bacterium]|nr:SgcJ/EcaC family oxidoreductase [Cyclobacteriaceae bacterium]